MCYKTTSFVLNLRGISPTDKFVLSILAHHLNNETGQCNPSISTIIDATGYGKTTIIHSIARLKLLGLIQKKGKNYTIITDTEVQNLNQKVQNLNLLDHQKIEKSSKSEPEKVQNLNQKGSKSEPITEKNKEDNREKEKIPKRKSFQNLKIEKIPIEWQAYAESKNLSQRQTEIQFEKFKNFWLSKGEVKADWLATWRNWIINQIEKYGLKPDKPQPTSTESLQDLITRIDAGRVNWTQNHTLQFRMTENQARQLIAAKKRSEAA